MRRISSCSAMIMFSLSDMVSGFTKRNIHPLPAICNYLRRCVYDGWVFGIEYDGTLLFSACAVWHVLSGPGVLATGVWSHVAVTRTGGAYTLYYNGSQVSSGAGASWTGSTAPLQFGYDPGSGQHFNGLLDEVSIYDRALSSNEVAAIYAAGSAGKCKPLAITTQPRSQLGFWGKSATFTVAATGEQPMSYQWQKGGTPITGASDASLVLTNLQMTDAGAYSVVVTNVYGSVTSSPAILTMNPAGVSLALYAGVTIDGVVGLTYGIQYTTDLSSTNSWRGLANVTLSVPTQLWLDLQPAAQPQRYYRVVPGPISVP